MAKTKPFDLYFNEYDKWFEDNDKIYLSELNAIKRFIPNDKLGIEIGVGTAKFASPLSIRFGIEPSKRMAKISKEKGIKVIKGVAENLPLKKESMDFILMVTTICFVDDIKKSLNECYMALKKEGFIVIGFVDKESDLGKVYIKKREKSKFYKEATFYSTKEVLGYLKKAGFIHFDIVQTIYKNQNISVQPVKSGYNEGSFIVIKGYKN